MRAQWWLLRQVSVIVALGAWLPWSTRCHCTQIHSPLSLLPRITSLLVRPASSWLVHDGVFAIDALDAFNTNIVSALSWLVWSVCPGCDGNELKAWARPAIVEPPPITVGSGDKDDDGLVDVESDADSDERDEAQMAGAPPRERHSRGVTADV